ncbi:MAG: phosphoglucosamine mutase [Phycisphaerales bacterium]
MSDSPLMVGVSGLRGIVGGSLTREVAEAFAGACGRWLRERAAGAARPKVVIGRDGREGGETIHGWALGALMAAGCDVVDLAVAMTPTVGLIVDHIDAAGGLIVTASHNPQEWNGLKCLVRAGGEVSVAVGRSAACAPGAAEAGEIVALFRAAGGKEANGGAANGDAGHGTGSGATRLPGRHFDYPEAHRVHVGRVLTSVEDELPAIQSRRFRVLVDSVNASGADGARELLTRLGCELIHHGAERSGVFPHPPEPTRENLAGMASAMGRLAADIGFAQDPDADRLAIVDGQGRYIGEEYTLALAAEAALGEGTEGRRDGGTIGKTESGAAQRVLVTNLSTSRMIDDVAARHGARVVRTPVGEANVVEAMKREAAAGADVVLGGEGNGGVIWPSVTYVRDSLSAMALVLSLMARTGRSVAELVAGVPSYAIEKRKVEIARREDASPAVEKIAAAYGEHRVDRQDGVRVDFARGPLAGKAWLHVRASNTEPIMRLIAEAPTAAEARAVLDEAARVIGG